MAPSTTLNLGFLLLPLVGGYLFLEITHWTRFTFRKYEGYRLFFAAATSGTICLGLGRILTYHLSTPLGNVTHLFKAYFPFRFSGAATCSFVLAALAAYAVNRAVPKTRALRKVAEKTDEMLLLLVEAQSKRLPILLTLNNRKAYVGYVLDTANLSSAVPYFKILPTSSGYRKEDMLHLELDTIYNESSILLEKYWRGEQLSSYDDDRLFGLQIVLSRTNILTASLFNRALYQEHHARRQALATDSE